MLIPPKDLTTMAIPHDDEIRKVTKEWVDNQIQLYKKPIGHNEDFTIVTFDSEGSNQYPLIELAEHAFQQGYYAAIADRRG